MSKQSSLFASIGIVLAGLGLTYAPLPGISQTIIIVSGSELEEPLKALEQKFEQSNPSINVEVKVQGSRELTNKYLDDQNDFNPTILIPANGELLNELASRWKTQNSGDAFYDQPRPIAKTMMVGIAWPDRGKTLFPNGRFDWQRLERAIQVGAWQGIGGKAEWGSFDLLISDPTRSNGGQLALLLGIQAKLGGIPLTSASLSSPVATTFVNTMKKSVYKPPRSSDILLQEYIARGPNDADIALVYESNALYRWQQAGANQGKPYQKPYQIYYLDQTVETVSTAAIVRRDVNQGQAKAARTFLDFLGKPEQQAVFVQFGFRPVTSGVNLQAVPNSPWSQNVPGAEVNPPSRANPMPSEQTFGDIIRLWERAN
jgi:ABC-type molybdate transport system substrate-binding protein